MSTHTEARILELCQGATVVTPETSTCLQCQDTGTVPALYITVHRSRTENDCDRTVTARVEPRPCGGCRKQDEDGRGKYDRLPQREEPS